MPLSSLIFGSIASLEYRDMNAPPPLVLPEESHATDEVAPSSPGYSEEQMLAQVELARAEAAACAEQCFLERGAREEAQRQTQVTATLQAFATERATYFQRVETEVVQLALSIARKILQREAELDPTLVSALVRIALDRLNAGPIVRVRLTPEELAQWPQMENAPYRCEMVPDKTLQVGDCIVETEMGEANFGLEAQLKEVEQGLFDLLARRPGVR